MNKVAVRTLWLACAVATGARGADGDLDASFGVGGVVLDPTAFANYPGFAMQSDGRLILCDTRIASTSGYDFYVARFDANGAPDATFGEGGAVLIAFGSGIDDFDDSCDAVAVQADGKIVLAGTRVTPGFPLPTFAEFAVARIEADGAPDTTFGAGTGTTHFAFAGFDQGGGANAVAVDAQGRIVVAGYASGTRNTDFAVVRLLPDGTLDPAFGTGGLVTVDFGTYDTARAVVIDDSQRTLVTGIADSDAAVVRLLADGSRDPAFGDAGIAHAGFDRLPAHSGWANGLVVDHRGRIVVAGAASIYDVTAPVLDMGIARFLDDGSLDASFGSSGIATVPFDLADAGGGADVAFGVVEASDGRIVLAGSAEYGANGYGLAAAARLDESGTPDASFGQAGKAAFDFGAGDSDDQWFNKPLLQGGRVVVAGGLIVWGGASPGGDLLVRLENDRIFAAAFE